jgi:hypothetical protein
MATKKKAAKKKTSKSKGAASIAISAAALRFNPRWFSDPPPDIFRVNQQVLRQINQLKVQFTKQFNEIVKKG